MQATNTETKNRNGGEKKKWRSRLNLRKKQKGKKIILEMKIKLKVAPKRINSNKYFIKVFEEKPRKPSKEKYGPPVKVAEQ